MKLTPDFLERSSQMYYTKLVLKSQKGVDNGTLWVVNWTFSGSSAAFYADRVGKICKTQCITVYISISIKYKNTMYSGVSTLHINQGKD